MASVFAARGDSAMVMRGEDGLDEFTTAAPTRVWAAQGGTVREAVLDATDLGVPRSTLADLRGGDAAYNAGVARRLLAGETGPVRDAVLVNAAAALATQGPLDGDLTEALRAGLARAAESIDSGAAAATLDRWIETATAASPPQAAGAARPAAPPDPWRAAIGR